MEIGAPPERVYAELAEPSSQIGLQPLIVRVDECVRGEHFREFEAVERLRFGLESRIRVRVTLVQPDRRVDFHARAPLGVQVRAAWSLEPVRSGTAVVESVEVQCPFGLGWLVVPTARRAQRGLLANLKRRLEDGAAQ